MQYRESVAKTRELAGKTSRVMKLEEIATREHNQLVELSSKLNLGNTKTTDLEIKLINEQDSKHCR